MATDTLSPSELSKLATTIKQQGATLGFQQVGIADTDLSMAEAQLMRWLEKNFHGEMDYMARHGSKRSRPAELVPGTVRIISVRMDYFPPNSEDEWSVINEPHSGYISRYALGRDYHKLMRKRLQKLAQHIEKHIGPFGYRAFVDSAPVLEKAIAQKAGLGWIGKHSNLLNRDAGSWFFLGEIYTDLPLPIDQPRADHCGSCQACIDCCPTQAITGPREVDARRCISYLTIELKGTIPVEFRPLIGNRIYGCDDCQLVCPWNRFARSSELADFAIRQGLDNPVLVDLFNWTEREFLTRMEGSAIRRIGYQRWLRNIAVALGNATATPEIISALTQRINDPSPLVAEHVEWALLQHHRPEAVQNGDRNKAIEAKTSA